MIKLAKQILLSAILVMFLSTAGLAVSSSHSLMGSLGMGNAGNTGSNEQAVNNETLRQNFLEKWNQTYKNAGFTFEQTNQLANELQKYVKFLAENYTELSGLMVHKGKVTGEETTKLDKRIELKEAERDLIVDLAEQRLGEFLTESQVNLVMMAAFHGVSLSYSGKEHLNVSHGQMNQKMNTTEQASMDIANLAEKLNVDCQAVSLGIILDFVTNELKSTNKK